MSSALRSCQWFQRRKVLVGVFVACLLLLSAKAKAVDSDSTCWVYTISDRPPGSGSFNINLDEHSWPDPYSALAAIRASVLSASLDSACLVWDGSRSLPKGTASRIVEGDILPTRTTSGPVGDPRTGIVIGYGQVLSFQNAAGENCLGSGGIGATDGIRWNFPQCRQRYVIKLAPASGQAESDTVITSIEPGVDPRLSPTTADTALLVARVYDQSGQLVPNINVRLTVDVVARSGGHEHDDSDRHQNYAGKLSSVGNANGTVTDNGKTLTGNTSSAGLLFRFTSPTYPNNPAGDHDITAECIGKTCKQEGPKRVWVGVRGLTRIPSLDVYVMPPNSDTFHPDNYYMTPLATQRLAVLAALYRGRFPNSPLLYLNDASLERGGMFDAYWVNSAKGTKRTIWWTEPHQTHQRGTDIDVRANPAINPGTAIPEENFPEFRRISARVGATAQIHSPGTSNQHFHVMF